MASKAKCKTCYRTHLPEAHDNFNHTQEVLLQFVDLLQGYAKRHKGVVTSEYIDEVLTIVLSPAGGKE